jgi:phage terminase large subunit GpA-like protein
VTLLSNPERLLREAVAAALKPPPVVDLLGWTANVVFGPGEARPGPYDRKAFVYFDEILRALGPDDPARIVTVAASAQIGKTVLGNIFVLGSATMGRGTVMIVHPTIENAARWSRMKLAPMMRAIPSVAAVFPARARRGRRDSVQGTPRRPREPAHIRGEQRGLAVAGDGRLCPSG